MCDDHHQLLRGREGEGERERGEGEGERGGGRGREREAKRSWRRLQLNFISRLFLFMEAGITQSFATYSHEEHSVYDIPSLNDPEETHEDKTRRGI